MIRRTLKILLSLCALYLLAAMAIMIAGLREDYRPADAAVVFGNKVEPWGDPSPSLAARLDKAVLLYHQGLYPRVIVSGGFGKEGWDEAEVMAGYLAANGVPREAILIDRAGNNTYLTALHTRELAEQHNLRSFVLVSHFYHLPRARLAFHRLGMPSTTIAHADRFVFRDFYFGLLREVIAYPAYFFRQYE